MFLTDKKKILASLFSVVIIRLMRKVLFFTLLVALMCLYLFADDKEDLTKNIFQAGTFYLNGSSDEAIAILERLHGKYPDSGIVKMYLGKCYMSKGAEAFWPWVKIKWARIGMALVNEAVSENPANIFIRLERFRDYSVMPSIFHPDDIVFKDLDILIKQIDELNYNDVYEQFKLWDAFVQFNPFNPDEEWMKVFFKQMVFCIAGDKYFAMGDKENARIMMEEAEKLGTDLFYGIYAYSWLDKYGYKQPQAK